MVGRKLEWHLSWVFWWRWFTLGGRRINLNGFLTNAVCSVVIAWGTILFSNIPGVEININSVIIGSIMPLVPRLPLRMQFRDIFCRVLMLPGLRFLRLLLSLRLLLLELDWDFL